MSEKIKKELPNSSEQPAVVEIIGPWKVAWKRFKKNKVAIIGGIIFIVLVFLVVFAPYLTPYDRDALDLKNVKKPPSWSHWLGTDKLGRDYFTRVLFGGRVSLMVGVISVGISVTIGTFIGGIAGYYGKWVDNLLMRFAEIVYSLPFIPLVITLSYVFGSIVRSEHRLFMVMFLIGAVNWPALARLIRGQILSLREQEFMLAATALGISDRAKIFRHLIPNTLGYIIVYATIGMASAILTESALSFLGLGVVPPTPTWGNMIQSYVKDTFVFKKMPWLWIPPGMFIMLAVVSINLLGEGLRDAFDPKSIR